MSTANDEFLSMTIEHSIGVERYKAQIIRQINTLLAESKSDLEDVLYRRLAKIVADGGFDNGPKTTERIRVMMAEIEKVRGGSYSRVRDLLWEDLPKLATYETEWQRSTLLEVLPVEIDMAMPTAELIKSAVFAQPFQGAVMEDWVAGMEVADLDRIKRQIQIGVVEGKTVGQMVTEVVGGAEDAGVLEVSRKGAESVVRTAVNYTVNAAREEVWKQNKDIIKGLRWLSVLDGRTSTLCASRDGNIYPVSSGPRPPAHWNCRSSMVPVIDGMNVVMDRPSVADTRRPAERNRAFRAEARANAGDSWKDMTMAERNAAMKQVKQKWVEDKIGHEPSKLTYEQWLRKQSDSFQAEVLGVDKSKLFRDGKLPLDKFIDNSGHEYTLNQLREREAQAFKKARL
jgi:SPP1 gp7 family putative phage head morphogenesis protein